MGWEQDVDRLGIFNTYRQVVFANFAQYCLFSVPFSILQSVHSLNSGSVGCDELVCLHTCKTPHSLKWFRNHLQFDNTSYNRPEFCIRVFPGSTFSFNALIMKCGAVRGKSVARSIVTAKQYRSPHVLRIPGMMCFTVKRQKDLLRFPQLKAGSHRIITKEVS